MSISFSPNQMDLFAKSESSYWTLAFELRKALGIEPGEYFGPLQILNIVDNLHTDEVATDLFKRTLGYSHVQVRCLVGTHAYWAKFQVSLRDLREGKTTMAQVREDRKRFVNSLDEYEKKVYLG